MEENPGVMLVCRASFSLLIARKVPDSAALRQDDRVGYSADTLMLAGA
jgi:hypothetical protein